MTSAPHLLPGSRQGFKYGVGAAARRDGVRRPDRRLRPGGDGRVDRAAQRRAGHRPRAAGRVRRAVAPAGRRRRRRTGCSTRRSCRCRIPQRKGDPVEFREDEGIRADTTAESLARLRPAFAKDGTITAGTLVADLRRRLRGRGDVPGEGRGARRSGPGRDRRARRGRRPGQLAAVPAGQRDPQGAATGRGSTVDDARPGRDQRGVRRGRHPVDARARASTTTRSTSTAAPSPSATRSG